MEAFAVARAVTPDHASKLGGYGSKPLLDFVTGLIGREDDMLRSIREDLASADERAPQAAAMRECLRLSTDESIFSSCAMIPTGEGMAVAVRR